MAEKPLSFTTYNCTGFKNRNYDFLRDAFSKCQVLFMQETWLYNAQHKDIANVLPNCQYHAVSAMPDTDVGRVGRPYGGCAIVWHSGLALSCRPLPTTSRRLCAVAAETRSHSMLWLTVYMPVDDGTTSSFNEYGEVLAEMSALLALHEGREVIIGGDFTVDMNRPSRNLPLFCQFIMQENLSNVQSHPECYTFESAIGSKSKIDYFLVSNDLYIPTILSATLDSGINLSQHSALCIKLPISPVIINHKDVLKRKTILDWRNSNEIHINNYKRLIDHHLQELSIQNYDFIKCNNKLCTIHDNEILSLLDKFSEILNKCA